MILIKFCDEVISILNALKWFLIDFFEFRWGLTDTYTQEHIYIYII